MPNLVIHIGGPKCGSSAIQGILFHGRNMLARNYNVYWLTSDFTIDSSKAESHTQLLKQLKSVEAKVIKSRFQNLSTSLNQDSTIIISSEGLCTLRDDNYLLYAHKLFEASQFYNIKIILYIRSQVDVIHSGWQQWGLAYSFDDWVSTALQRNFCNWLYIYNAYAQIFGHNSIIVRPFDRSSFLNGSIVYDFMPLVVEKMSNSQIETINSVCTKKKINPSFGDLECLCLQTLGRAHSINIQTLVHTAKKQGLAVCTTDKMRNILLSIDTINKIYNYYQDSNHSLYKLLGSPNSLAQILTKYPYPNRSEQLEQPNVDYLNFAWQSSASIFYSLLN